MEVMEVIYDYPDQFGRKDDRVDPVYNDPNNKDSRLFWDHPLYRRFRVYGLLTTVPWKQYLDPWKEPCLLNYKQLAKACLSSISAARPLQTDNPMSTAYLMEVVDPKLSLYCSS